jgi:hypothetical protein
MSHLNAARGRNRSRTIPIIILQRSNIPQKIIRFCVSRQLDGIYDRDSGRRNSDFINVCERHDRWDQMRHAGHRSHRSVPAQVIAAGGGERLACIACPPTGQLCRHHVCPFDLTEPLALSRSRLAIDLALGETIQLFVGCFLFL